MLSGRHRCLIRPGEVVHVLVIPRGLYVLPGLPSVGVFEQHQAAALRDAGIQVGVLSGGVITARHFGRRIRFQRHDQVNGIPVLRAHRRSLLPARWESPQTAADRGYLRLRPLLVDYIREHGRPDLVHAHNLASGGLIACRIAEDFDLPYVVTEHTGTYSAQLAAVRRDVAVLDMAAARANVIIAVGTPLAENLRNSLNPTAAAKVAVVPNVVEPGLLVRPLAARRAHPFTIAALGNLIPSKNYRLLVSAFHVADLPADSQLVIGGKGPEARALKSAAKAHGVGDRVRFVGHLDRHGVGAILTQADLFAHPSDHESFGVVLIEAMAMGVPVVATDSGGPADIVTKTTGLLTPVGDVEAFTAALGVMYSVRSEFDSALIRQSCRDRFGPEAFARQMLAIYQRAKK